VQAQNTQKFYCLISIDVFSQNQLSWAVIFILFQTFYFSIFTSCIQHPHMAKTAMTGNKQKHRSMNLQVQHIC